VLNYLKPSWVDPDAFAAYLDDPDLRKFENNSPPKERLQEAQPDGHVPYVDSISVADVLLSGAEDPFPFFFSLFFFSPIKHLY
jgi:hypothetical protein